MLCAFYGENHSFSPKETLRSEALIEPQAVQQVKQSAPSKWLQQEREKNNRPASVSCSSNSLLASWQTDFLCARVRELECVCVCVCVEVCNEVIVNLHPLISIPWF